VGRAQLSDDGAVRGWLHTLLGNMFKVIFLTVRDSRTVKAAKLQNASSY